MTDAIRFFMRCNRSIDGEQQVNDPARNNALVNKPTKELTLISTDANNKPFEPHVQHATFAATLVFGDDAGAGAFENVRRGKLVRVTVEVIDESELPSHEPVGGDAPAPGAANPAA